LNRLYLVFGGVVVFELIAVFSWTGVLQDPFRDPILVLVPPLLVGALLTLFVFAPHVGRRVQITSAGIHCIPMFYAIYGPIGVIMALAAGTPTRPSKLLIVRQPAAQACAMMLVYSRYSKTKIIGIDKSVSMDSLATAIAQFGVPMEWSDKEPEE
jgi:hypothetical protein